MKGLASVGIALLLVGILLLGVNEMPAFGDLNNPSNNYVYEKYVEDTPTDTGALNAVTSIVLEYRAFDTLGESIVLFMGVITVIILLNPRYS